MAGGVLPIFLMSMFLSAGADDPRAAEGLLQTRTQRKPCGFGDIQKFRLQFIGLWSRERFPKQYPEYRPHAQFGRLIGKF